MAKRQKITTFLWFDKEAEEAASFYTSIFKDSEVLSVARYGEAGPGPKGTAMTVEFQLFGQRFIALNGGPYFKFSEAISLFVDCESQAEVDALWEKLTSSGGKEGQCGWLKDRYGLSWQLVPSAAMTLLHDADPERAGRAMRALLTMQKIDLGALERAHAGA
jgi:predicted 3-demethylubiquinone-9 3-methyltransferase (glyoxalase superfamily)